MRPWLVPARPARIVEATVDQVVATGSMLGAYGRDPIDGDVGYKLAGKAGNREVPYWTREKARVYSVTAYRSNPMATAIIDTYTAFCVGDKGVTWQASNDQVAEIVKEFWEDPANNLGGIQEVSLRSQLLLGEKLYQLLVGPASGVVRFSPVDPANIEDVSCRFGNPLWPDQVLLPGRDNEGLVWDLAQINDATGLREGEAMFWAPWRTLDTDTRGMPFLTSVLDWLDSYDTVLSNLIDRTALARYMVWDVTVAGGQDKVNEFVDARGGLHVPPSGSVEVHNDAVTWKPQSVSSGAFEDTAANASVLTNIASGAGLSKTWLAEPDGANRATSLTMAEPVRRRVGGIQKTWLGQQTELVRFAVDRAVAAGRLPRMVEATDPRTGKVTQIPASQAVIVTGPEIAASDSELTAQVLLNLSTGLANLVNIGALSEGAAATAARKAWEDYVGVPYVHELDTPTTNPADVADVVESAARTRERHRSGGDYVRDPEGKFAHVPGAGVIKAAGHARMESGPVSDPLKLADRIALQPGERFGGSAKIGDGIGDHTLVMARVDGPDGTKIRLGVVEPESARTWRAADKGRTVELDTVDAAQLRDVLGASLDQGKKNVTDFRAQLRAAHSAGLPQSQWPNPEEPISSGSITTGWGVLNWNLSREMGDDYESGGVNLGPGGQWSLGLDPQPATADDARDEFNIIGPSTLRKIDQALANLLAADVPPAAAQEAKQNGDQLKDYWTRGEGLAKWSTHAHPWTALRDHLLKFLSPDRADRTASQWFHDVFGYWSGDRKGSNPVGPG